MATYEAWNHALLSYFVAGAPRGITVFLSADDDILNSVGHSLPGTDSGALNDFCNSVSARVVQGNSVDLAGVSGRNAAGEPNAIAFLAAMVLAASQMADSGEGFSETNYFRRLNSVLGLPGERGRPHAMRAGAEEPLWQEWAQWLQEHEFLPSARPGKRAHRYIAYPISQALLRGADKDRLQRLFADKHWVHPWDAETLMAKIRRESGALPHHLQELLTTQSQRYEAVAGACYELFKDWQSHQVLAGSVDRLARSYLVAGLYRTQDIFLGEVEYYLYPQMPPRKEIEVVVVQSMDGPLQIEADRPGWLRPVLELPRSELGEEIRYPVVQPDDLDYLVFPARQFWILVKDPEQQDSGIFATWGPPVLGQHFIVVCSKDLLPQLEQLRAEKLIEWSGDPHPLSNPEWVEVRGCMVLKSAWFGVFIENMELLDALHPRSAVALSIHGGLRVPHSSQWLDGHGPLITVFGSPSEVRLRVSDITGQDVVADYDQQTNVPISIRWPRPGRFRVEVEYDDDIVARLVAIVAWDGIRLNIPTRYEVTEFGSWSICGGLVEGSAN